MFSLRGSELFKIRELTKSGFFSEKGKCPRFTLLTKHSAQRGNAGECAECGGGSICARGSIRGSLCGGSIGDKGSGGGGRAGTLALLYQAPQQQGGQGGARVYDGVRRSGSTGGLCSHGGVSRGGACGLFPKTRDERLRRDAPHAVLRPAPQRRPAAQLEAGDRR